MTFLERELEEFLFYFLEDNTENLLNELNKKGLFVDATTDMVFKRQMDLSPYGVADIVGIDASCTDGTLYANVYVFELKKDKIGYSALGQAYRYLRAIDIQLKKKAKELCVDIQKNYKVFLIGTDIELSNDFCFIESFFDDLVYCTASFSPMDGIVFTEHSGYIKGNGEEVSDSILDIINKIEDYKKI